MGECCLIFGDFSDRDGTWECNAIFGLGKWRTVWEETVDEGDDGWKRTHDRQSGRRELCDALYRTRYSLFFSNIEIEVMKGENS